LTDTLVNGPIRQLNRLIELYNRIPALPDIEPLGLTGVGDTAQQNIERAERAIEIGKQDIESILMKPMPSTSVEQALQDIQDRARETSEKFARERAKMDDAMLAPSAPEEDDEARERAREAAERHREQLEARIDRIREANMEEKELAEKKHEEDMERLREAKELEILTEKEFNELREDIEEKHQENLNKIMERGERDRHDMMGRFAKANLAIRENSIASEVGALRSGLQTMFGDHKQFGEALGNLKRLEAVISAYAWGSSIGGPPMGAAAAAAAGAAQLATLNDMKSSDFSGGSSQPSAGSTSAPTGAGQAGGQGGGMDRTFHIEGVSPGQLYSGDQLRGLLETIEEASEDGRTRIRLS